MRTRAPRIDPIAAGLPYHAAIDLAMYVSFLRYHADRVVISRWTDRAQGANGQHVARTREALRAELLATVKALRGFIVVHNTMGRPGKALVAHAMARRNSDLRA